MKAMQVNLPYSYTQEDKIWINPAVTTSAAVYETGSLYHHLGEITLPGTVGVSPSINTRTSPGDFFKGNALGYNNLTLMALASGGAVPPGTNGFQLRVEDMINTFTVRSTHLAPMPYTVYKIVTRGDITVTYDSGAALSTRQMDPIGALNTGLVSASALNGSTKHSLASQATPLTHPDCTPYMSPVFCTKYKILKQWNGTLAPSQTMTFTHKYKYPRTFDNQAINGYNSTTGDFILAHKGAVSFLVHFKPPVLQASGNAVAISLPGHSYVVTSHVKAHLFIMPQAIVKNGYFKATSDATGAAGAVIDSEYTEQNAAL